MPYTGIFRNSSFRTRDKLEFEANFGEFEIWVEFASTKDEFGSIRVSLEIVSTRDDFEEKLRQRQGTGQASLARRNLPV